MGANFITRFAPSPTGLLHLGHAFSAITAHDAARAAGGLFLLRLEDIDETRCRPEFASAIIDDLKWLGISWDGPIARQSERRGLYEAARAKLEALGLLYRCFKTRKEILEDIARAPHSPGEDSNELIISGAPSSRQEEAERLANGESFAWRLSLKAAREQLGDDFGQLYFEESGFGPRGETGLIRARPELMGDVILARKDLGVAYHLAAVIDDAAQNVTLIIRGEDLFASTHAHRLLQQLLGLSTPAYRHHSLILDDSGKRYAKRDKAHTLRALRESGLTPKDVRAMVGLA